MHVVEQQADLERRPPDQGVDDVARSRRRPPAGPAGIPARGNGTRGNGTGADGAEEGPGEAGRIFVCRLAAHPDVDPARRDLVRPYRLGQDGGLAEARSRHEQRHRPVPAALEQPDEPQARKLDIQDARQGHRLGHQRSGG